MARGGFPIPCVAGHPSPHPIGWHCESTVGLWGVKTTTYRITFSTSGIWQGEALSLQDAIILALAERVKTGQSETIRIAEHIGLHKQWVPDEIPTQITLYVE